MIIAQVTNTVPNLAADLGKVITDIWPNMSAQNVTLTVLILHLLAKYVSNLAQNAGKDQSNSNAVLKLISHLGGSPLPPPTAAQPPPPQQQTKP